MEDKPCIDCEKKEPGNEKTLMEVVDILKWKGLSTDEVARYCKYGLVSMVTLSNLMNGLHAI